MDLTAPAKLNLSLRVLGRRADGYHDLDSLVVFLDLSDRIALRPAAAWSVAFTGPLGRATGPLSWDQTTFARALAGWRQHLGTDPPPRAVTVDKHIPLGGGLGGGTSDAAALLAHFAATAGVARQDPRLWAAARAIGADGPVCLHGVLGGSRVWRLQGLGDRVAPVAWPDLSDHLLLLNPGAVAATPAVFAQLAQPGAAPPRPGAEPGQAGAGGLGAERGAAPDLARLANDLEPAAMALVPAIAQALATLRQHAPGLRVAMTGSGATVYGLYGTAEARDRALDGLRPVAAARGWWLAAATILGPDRDAAWFPGALI